MCLSAACRHRCRLPRWRVDARVGSLFTVGAPHEHALLLLSCADAGAGVAAAQLDALVAARLPHLELLAAHDVPLALDSSAGRCALARALVDAARGLGLTR